MNAGTLRRDYAGNLGMCSLALLTMPFIANVAVDDLGPHRSYFQHHPMRGLALIAVPAVLHFLVQSAIREGMQGSHDGSLLVRSLKPACIFVAAFTAGLAEAAVGAFLFLACFP